MLKNDEILEKSEEEIRELKILGLKRALLMLGVALLGGGLGLFAARCTEANQEPEATYQSDDDFAPVGYALGSDGNCHKGDVAIKPTKIFTSDDKGYEIPEGYYLDESNVLRQFDDSDEVVPEGYFLDADHKCYRIKIEPIKIVTPAGEDYVAPIGYTLAFDENGEPYCYFDKYYDTEDVSLGESENEGISRKRAK